MWWHIWEGKGCIYYSLDLVRRIYILYRYKERGTCSLEQVLDLVQLICGDIYGKERGLTREGLSLYLSTTHMWWRIWQGKGDWLMWVSSIPSTTHLYIEMKRNGDWLVRVYLYTWVQPICDYIYGKERGWFYISKILSTTLMGRKESSFVN